MPANRDAKKHRETFASWLSFSRQELRRLSSLGQDVATSRSEFGRRVGVSDSTLARWVKESEDSDSDMGQMLAAARERKAVVVSDPLGGDEVPDVGFVSGRSGSGGLSDAELEFRSAREALLRQAMGGDVSAVKVWMQLFGQSFVEQERALLQSDLSHLSDSELVGEFVTLAGVETVGRVLDGFQ